LAFASSCLPPALAGAQDPASDKRYCAALLDKTCAMPASRNPGTPGKLSNDNTAGIAQAKCQAGDTTARHCHPERKLRDAKLDPPPAPLSPAGGWECSRRVRRIVDIVEPASAGGAIACGS